MKNPIRRKLKIIFGVLIVFCMVCENCEVLAATTVSPSTKTSTAQKLKFGTEYTVKMSKNSYRHYYSFTLNKPGGISVNITHKSKNISGNPTIMNLMVGYQDGLSTLSTIVRDNETTSTTRVGIR